MRTGRGRREEGDLRAALQPWLCDIEPSWARTRSNGSRRLPRVEVQARREGVAICERRPCCSPAPLSSRFSLLSFKVPVVGATLLLGAAMVVGGVGSWVKSTSKVPVTAATMVTLVGVMRVLALFLYARGFSAALLGIPGWHRTASSMAGLLSSSPPLVHLTRFGRHPRSESKARRASWSGHRPIALPPATLGLR